MNLKIFYSHAWNDKAGAKVKKLLLLLQKDYEVWLDKKQIDNGDHINDTVARGIAGCDIFINVWSKNAHYSKGVLFELETAAKLNKPMLALRIDDFDINVCPQLTGKEYIDFSGDDASFTRQQVYLTNFLLRKKIELFKKHSAGAASEKIILELEKKLSSLQDILIEVEDSTKRQQLGASGNDDSDVYIQSSLNAFEKSLDDTDDDSQMMKLFAARMKEISASHPLKKDDAIKKSLALKAVTAIDPAGKNKRLNELKIFLQQDADVLNVNTPAAVPAVASVVNSNDAALVAAYKNSVAKTKNIVLQKSKTGLEDIPFLNLLSSLSKELTELEMSYVTNSPAVLEKMYEAAVNSADKELQGIVTILIRHIKPEDLLQCEAAQKVNAYNHYAYLINNTARLLVQAKALKEETVSYSLVSSTGLDKISKIFFKDDWKEKAEQFLDTVKNNYGIKDKNLQWLTAAATIIGVALIADGVADSFEGDAASGSVAAGSNSPVYFEDKMAAMGFDVPNTVQW